MIRVDNLVKKYGETAAVNGISFELAPGEVVGFLGPNGAGKTTTLRVLSGFLEPTDGRVTIFDKDTRRDPIACRRKIGYLPENNPLYEDMEVSEYLGWAAGLRGLTGEAGRNAIKRAVERCSLADVIGRDIAELSKGYRQRVGLAQAILHDPPVLLLDEPTSGLDPNQAAEVRELIAHLRQEKTVLLSTHILSEARASCDRIIIINKGRIAVQGKPDTLAANASRETRIHLLLAPNGPDREETRRQLQELPGVLSVSYEDTTQESDCVLSIDPAAQDLRERVFRFAVENKLPVLELYKEEASLEELFRSLTA